MVAVFASMMEAEVNRAFHLGGFQGLARHREVEVDLGEHLGVVFGALGVDVHHAVGDVRTALLEDVHHVVGGAAAGADQHGFHRAWPEIATAAFRRAVHDQRVSAAGFADEGDVFKPFDARFHAEGSSAEREF